MNPQVTALSNHVQPYVPEGTSLMVAQLIVEHKIHVTLTKHRATKLGDYRPPQHGKGHRISVNKNLNPYSFLITFVHEVAHLTCWNQFQNRVAPHGKEWKMHFKILMEPFLRARVFPEKVDAALQSYMRNPAASSCADVTLLKALQEHQPDDGLVHLEDLEEHQVFELEGRRIFQKGPRERKRFRCLSLDNKRYYFVNALARVRPVNKT